jgi:acyl carrier protein
MIAIDPNGIPCREKVMRTVIDLVARVVDEKRRIEPETALFSSLEMFDSFALLELVLRLEGTFGLSIPDQDLDADTFSSPLSIVNYLCGRLNNGTKTIKESLNAEGIS